MGNIGTPEIFVVLIIAMLVLGPNRLPQAARSFGKAMAEFRRVTGGLQAEMRDAVSHLESELNVLKDDPTPAAAPPAPYVFDPPEVPNQPGLPIADEEVPPPVEEPLVTEDAADAVIPVEPSLPAAPIVTAPSETAPTETAPTETATDQPDIRDSPPTASTEA